jgi:subtilase family serine protease
LKVPKHAKRRRTAVAVATATLIPAAALIASTAAASPGGAARTKVTVSQGIGAAALKNASVFGTTPASTPEVVSFVLRGRNARELAREAASGSSGLSVSEFAQRYGQSPEAIARITGYLKSYGITASVDADGLDVVAHGTAGEFDTALSVTQQNYYVPAVKAHNGQQAIPAQHIHGTKENPKLPSEDGGMVLAVLGLTNYSGFVTNLVHTPNKIDRSAKAAKSAATYTGTLTPADFAKQYNVSPLYKAGVTGAGTTLGIVTLAALSPTAPTYFWKNVLGISTKANRITTVNVDGGPGAPNENAGSGETDLDVEQSGALAPQANIVVYQAPNTDNGFVDSFYTAASDNTVDTLSTSWGESETYLKLAVAAGTTSATYAAAFDQAYEELDVQGESSFASSGDYAAYDALPDAGTTNLTVDNPADSPYTTAAGGTTLGGTISYTGTTGTVNVKIASQRAWGWDWLWKYWNTLGLPSTTETSAIETYLVTGGGGGYSALEKTPWYQEGLTGQYSAVEYLTPTTYQTVYGYSLPTAWTLNLTPSITTGYSSGRAVPDVSADADPFTGYLLYDPLASTPLAGGWGGTSFVSPQLNGVTALIDSYVGHRVGFWNPSIYQFAQSGDSPFTALDTSGTSNDNLYYTGTAGDAYNPATGLGSPNVAKLAEAFARS